MSRYLRFWSVLKLSSGPRLEESKLKKSTPVGMYDHESTVACTPCKQRYRKLVNELSPFKF